jgi:hypothetical protein
VAPIDDAELSGPERSGKALIEAVCYQASMAAPPSRRDDQTGSSAAFVEAVARAANTTVVIDGDDALIGAVRVPIERTPRDEIRRLVGVKSPRRRPVGIDDLRQLALALPGVTEKEVTRRDGRSVVSFEVAKVMFVKLFEAGNLLPPDLDDVVMIRRVPDRAALLATAPDRFFLTRHYGDPADTGPILTRLSENSRKDLPELSELFEESWARCAPKRLLASRGEFR